MTVKEIAALANVSPAAVSRFLNGGPLSESKREAIRRVIEETGFQPNKLARDLRRGEVRQIGVIVPRLYSNSAGEVTDGINSVLRKNGYMAVLGSTRYDDSYEEEYLKLMTSYRLAGVIVMATGTSAKKQERYRKAELPIVITGQNIRGVTSVFHDDEQAMQELTKRMLEKGRRHFVYIGVDRSDRAVGIKRREGFLKEVLKAGIAKEDIIGKTAEFSAESGYRKMQEILQEGHVFDAVLCATDSIALGALTALKEAGRKVPEEVSIAGIGNDWANRTSEPQMTVARLFQYECGQTAASLLLEMIGHKENKMPARSVMLGYTIEERGSI